MTGSLLRLELALVTAHSSGRQRRLPALRPSISAPASSNRRVTSTRPGARAGSRWKREAQARCRAVQPLPGSTRVAAPGLRRSSASTRVASPRTTAAGNPDSASAGFSCSMRAAVPICMLTLKPRNRTTSSGIAVIRASISRTRAAQLVRPSSRARASCAPASVCGAATAASRARAPTSPPRAARSNSFAWRRAWSRFGRSGRTDMTSPRGPVVRVPGPEMITKEHLRSRGELSSARGPGGTLTHPPTSM